MEILSAIVKLIEALAWPVTVLAVFVLLKKEIRQLVPLLRKLKAGPVEAEFECEIARLQQAVPQPPLPPTPTPQSPRRLELFGLAKTAPGTAILEAWADVEVTASRVVAREALQIPEHDVTSPLATIRAIAKSTTISAEWVSQYYDLRELRNKAAHQADFAPNVVAAAAFVEMASRLQRRIEEAQKRTS